MPYQETQTSWAEAIGWTTMIGMTLGAILLFVLILVTNCQGPSTYTITINEEQTTCTVTHRPTPSLTCLDPAEVGYIE